jgi:hypothetical protein
MWSNDDTYIGQWEYDKVFMNTDNRERLRIVKYPGKEDNIWVFYCKLIPKPRKNVNQEEKVWDVDERSHQFDSLEDAHQYYGVKFDETCVRFKSIDKLFMMEDRV